MTAAATATTTTKPSLKPSKQYKLPEEPYIPPPGKVLASGGVWRVPATDRPRGWEAMGLREPEDVARRFVSGAAGDSKPKAAMCPSRSA